MNVNDIRNFRGEKKFAFPSADPLHMELPNSRLKDSDAQVIEALEVYAKATRIEGKAKNLDFENLKGSKSAFSVRRPSASRSMATAGRVSRSDRS
jgi:hypothetical protein